MIPLYLASRSPRRKDLLSQASIRFQVHVPAEPELAAPKNRRKEQPGQIVRRISDAKAEACAAELRASGCTEALILAADTLVFLKEKVLSKPADETEACLMLKRLSGNWHTVATGVTVLAMNGKKSTKKSIHVTTRVKFFPLAKDWIHWYVKTGEPMDKAGAYGAQGYGAALVEKFAGSYTNVVGLPLGETLSLLEKISGHSRSAFQEHK